MRLGKDRLILAPFLRHYKYLSHDSIQAGTICKESRNYVVTFITHTLLWT